MYICDGWICHKFAFGLAVLVKLSLEIEFVRDVAATTHDLSVSLFRKLRKMQRCGVVFCASSIGNIAKYL